MISAYSEKIKHPVNMSNKCASVLKHNILIKMAHFWHDSYKATSFQVGSPKNSIKEKKKVFRKVNKHLNEGLRLASVIPSILQIK